MTTETFTMSSGSFGFIIGGITLLGLIINMARFHLPSNKIKVLESLLDETETFFNKAVEDGLLTEPSFVRETAEHLATLKRRMSNLQSCAYSATTLRQDYAEFLRGTSTSIGRACQSLRKIRAEVISSSEEGRRRLMEMNSAPRAYPPVQPCNPQTRAVNPVILPPAAEIIRPRSCPVSLSSWSSEDTQIIATSRSNPFNDRTWTDSGVQTTDAQESESSVYTSANLERTA